MHSALIRTAAIAVTLSGKLHNAANTGLLRSLQAQYRKLAARSNKLRDAIRETGSQMSADYKAINAWEEDAIANVRAEAIKRRTYVTATVHTQDATLREALNRTNDEITKTLRSISAVK